MILTQVIYSYILRKELRGSVYAKQDNLEGGKDMPIVFVTVIKKWAIEVSIERDNKYVRNR